MDTEKLIDLGKLSAFVGITMGIILGGSMSGEIELEKANIALMKQSNKNDAFRVGYFVSSGVYGFVKGALATGVMICTLPASIVVYRKYYKL